MQQEMIDRIHRMANRTWDVIGGDILTVMEEQGEGNTLTKDEVIECVSDASYMMYHGGDKEAYEEWNKLGWDDKAKVLKDAFPFATYGW